jgi:hypothetical protein
MHPWQANVGDSLDPGKQREMQVEPSGMPALPLAARTTGIHCLAEMTN